MFKQAYKGSAEKRFDPIVISDADECLRDEPYNLITTGVAFPGSCAST